jgi:hypothetical protein
MSMKISPFCFEEIAGQWKSVYSVYVQDWYCVARVAFSRHPRTA